MPYARRTSRLLAAVLLLAVACRESVTGPPDHPLPVLLRVDPVAIILGGAPPEIAVVGDDFVPETRVRVNGGDRATSFVNDTLLRAQLLADDVDTIAVLQVTAVTPAPGGGTSGMVPLGVGYPIPVAVAVSPNVVITGAAATELTVTGTGFHPHSRVRWNGAIDLPTTYVSATELRATLSDAVLVTPVAAWVTIMNPGRAASGQLPVSILNPAPTLTSIAPDSALRGFGGVLVTLTGTDFRPNVSVTLDGAARATTRLSSTTLRVSLANADVAAVGTRQFRVINPGPSLGPSDERPFRVVIPPPVIRNFVPASASAGDDETVLGILGADFDASAVVEVDGVAQPTTYVNGAELTVTLPPAMLATARTLGVRVRNPQRGTVSAVTGFSVLPPSPTLGAPLVVEQANNHIITDPVRQVLYASVPATAANHANLVVRIDPATGAVTGSVAAGSEPGRMAISDDGQYLYVALSGAGTVARIRLSDFVRNGELTLPVHDFFGSTRAEDLEVVPGNPTLVAVSLRNLCCSPRHMGVVLFADTTRLPVATQEHTGSNRLAIGNADELWGYNNESTEFGFRRIRISPDGLREFAVQTMMSGFGVDIEASGARVFSNTGAVVEPSSMTQVGTVPDATWGTVIRPDAPTGRVHALTDGTLVTVNWTSLTSIGSATIPEATGLSTMVRWGTDGLAIGGGARIVIVRGSLVGP